MSQKIYFESKIESIKTIDRETLSLYTVGIFKPVKLSVPLKSSSSMLGLQLEGNNSECSCQQSVTFAPNLAKGCPFSFREVGFQNPKSKKKAKYDLSRLIQQKLLLSVLALLGSFVSVARLKSKVQGSVGSQNAGQSPLFVLGFVWPQ